MLLASVGSPEFVQGPNCVKHVPRFVESRQCSIGVFHGVSPIPKANRKVSSSDDQWSATPLISVRTHVVHLLLRGLHGFTTCLSRTPTAMTAFASARHHRVPAALEGWTFGGQRSRLIASLSATIAPTAPAVVVIGKPGAIRRT